MPSDLSQAFGWFKLATENALTNKELCNLKKTATPKHFYMNHNN